MELSDLFSYGTLHQIIEDVAKKYPDKIALTEGGRHITYRELDLFAQKLSNTLLEKTQGHKCYICICFDKSIAAIICILAVLKIGCAYVPLDPMYPEQRLMDMIEDVDSNMVICPQDYDQKFVNKKFEVLSLSTNWYSEISPASAVCATSLSKIKVNPDDDAYVIYTSGTSGKPKGVPITHGNVLALFWGAKKIFDYHAMDVWTLFFSLAFDGSVMEIFGALLFGGRLVLVPYQMTRNPSAYYAILAKEKVTIMTLSPNAFKLFDEYESHLEIRANLVLRLIIFGGEKLNFQWLTSWVKRHPLDTVALFNLYGPTENTVVAAYHKIRLQDLEHTQSLIGVNFPNTDLRILNEKLQKVPIGEVGEIYLSGDSLTKGYHHQASLNQQKFMNIDGRYFYATGDLAKYHVEGEIEFVGRKDLQIKLNAYRIELQDIQSVALSFPGVKDCYVKKYDELNQLITYIEPNLDVEHYQVMPIIKNQSYSTLYRDLYDAMYQEKHAYSKDFNITGWNSSYTQTQLSVIEMQEWVDATVTTLKSFQPKRVLEIGFGTGLLLFRLHQDVDYYFGLDYSASAYDYVKRLIQDRGIHNVELMLGSAEEFDKIPIQEFDLIIVNSVVICMPNVAYLTRILTYYATHYLSEDGIIFVGDVRNYDLYHAFHSSVLTYLYPHQSKLLLKHDIFQQMIRDKDLVISPQYFHTLVAESSLFSAALTQVKKTQTDNELTMFRYDAILYRSTPTQHIAKKFEFNKEKNHAEQIKSILKLGHQIVMIEAAPNSRLQLAIMIEDWLNSNMLEEDTWTDNQQKAVLGSGNQISPYQMQTISQQYGYDLIMDCKRRLSQYAVDLVFVKNDFHRYPRIPIQYEIKLQMDPNTFQEAYSNEIQKVVCQNILANLQKYLQLRLPQFMVPHHYLCIPSFPLNAQSKIYHDALPSPKKLSSNRHVVAPPRNDIEAKILDIWAILFKKDKSQISIFDKFYHYGGDSIDAAKLMFLCKKEKIEFNIQQVLSNPTIAELGQSQMQQGLELQVSDVTEAIFSHEELPLLPIQVPRAIEHNFSQVIIYLLKPKNAYDPQKLSEICLKLINRHDALRLYFIKNETQWVQRISNPMMQPCLEVVDLRASHFQEVEKLMQEHYEAKLQQMDMKSEYSACTFILYQLPTEQRFFFAINQWCTDLLSIDVFWKELSALHFGHALLPLKMRYGQIIEHIQCLNLSRSWEDMKAFWFSEIKYAQPLVRTKTDLEQFSTMTRKELICEQLWMQRLLQYHHDELQIHDLLLAAFVKTVCRINRLEGICVLLLYHNRQILDAMSYTLGAFASPFPVYLSWIETLSNITLAKKIKNKIEDIRDKGIYFSFHFDKFLNHLMAQGNGNVHGLPKVAFNYLGYKNDNDLDIWEKTPEDIDADLVTLEGDNIQYIAKPQSTKRASTPLQGVGGGFMLLSKILNHRALQLTLIYDPNYFSAASIDGFFNDFQQTLNEYYAEILIERAMEIV